MWSQIYDVTVRVSGYESKIGFIDRSQHQMIAFVERPSGVFDPIARGYDLEELIALVLSAYEGPKDPLVYDPVAF